MKKFLLTHGDINYYPLLNLVAPWNQAYADRHGYDYREDRQRNVGQWDSYWEKYRQILEVMAEADDGDFIAFLDCDALIIKPDVDLITALPDDYDMATSRYPDNRGYAGWNLGSLFIRVNQATRKFYRSMLDAGPVSELEWAGNNETVGWEERRFAVDVRDGEASDEKSFTASMDKPSIRVFDLDSKWNYGHAVRPLGKKALANAVILHPAERKLDFKLWIIKQAMENISHGNLPPDPLFAYRDSWKVGQQDTCTGC